MASSASGEKPPDNCKNTTKTNKPMTRSDMKKTGTSIIVEDQEDIKDATEGRKFLEKHLLLCPPGEPINNTVMSTCLHQISRISGVPKQAVNAIRALAYLTEEMEEITINEIVREAVISQLNELTTDMKALVEDVKEKIDEHIQQMPTEKNSTEATKNQERSPSQWSYAKALINPPLHTNPRLAAREGIRARQMMLEGVDANSKVGQMNNTQLKVEFNRILTELGLKGKNIRSAITQKHKGILIEMENDAATNWMNTHENRTNFCKEIGHKVLIKQRVFYLIAHNVALTFDPSNKRHRDEVHEANHLEENTISTMRWAKPAERRSPDQRTAHLILMFTDPDAANRAIANGLTICNRRKYVEKLKKEPIRCLKCQGWNHFAYKCISKTDKCSNCAEEHRSRQCPHPHKRWCVTCNVGDHASWSRTCPAFIKKANECDRRNPENSLQFIPTTDLGPGQPKRKDTSLARETKPPETMTGTKTTLDEKQIIETTQI